MRGSLCSRLTFILGWPHGRSTELPPTVIEFLLCTKLHAGCYGSMLGGNSFHPSLPANGLDVNRPQSLTSHSGSAAGLFYGAPGSSTSTIQT